MTEQEQLKVALISLGCPKNLVDSEKMLALLAEAGCVVAAPTDEADVIVINTCGFLQAARAESLEVIAEAVEQKRIGRAGRVVVAGCMVNRDAEKLYELAPGIDAIVGVNNRRDIIAAVVGGERFTRVDPYPATIKRVSEIRNSSDAGRFRLMPRHTAYLRISEGCSHGCTFCTIPSIRGPFRSKQPDTVLAEARELIADGCMELNVIAQDTTSYGLDLTSQDSPRWNLACLLRELNGLDGARWIRLMYAYPNRFSDELIDTIAACEHVLPYVDLPLQHICDAVLKRMGRGVGRRKIETLLQKLRDKVSELVLRTTFIVGFPDETDEQFAELLTFVKEIRFDALGVFAFSAEPGTPAATMPHQVPDAVKAERVKAIMLAQQEIAFAANAALVGKAAEVLIDGLDGEGRCVGRTSAQAPQIDGICHLTQPREPGTFASATVAGYDDYDLIVKPN